MPPARDRSKPRRRSRQPVPRILVVDDDRATRHLLALQLRRAGYRVATTGDGTSALERIERERFDLVLLDVWMPGMDGLEVLARLRDSASRPKVVVMTADDTSETLLKAVREHACRYVTKPVEPGELDEVVRAALAAGPELRPIEVVSARPDWVELLVPCDREAAERIQDFLGRLDADLPEDVRASVGHAFRELLLNAIEWGGGLDPSKKVRIAYLRAKRMLLYRIADPGKGFSFEGLGHAAIGNPPDQPVRHAAARQRKGLRPGGFGLVMTRAMVDELLYNEKQNEVVFVKYLD
jgi:CheY-like chemotaxis protein